VYASAQSSAAKPQALCITAYDHPTPDVVDTLCCHRCGRKANKLSTCCSIYATKPENSSSFFCFYFSVQAPFSVSSPSTLITFWQEQVVVPRLLFQNLWLVIILLLVRMYSQFKLSNCVFTTKVDSTLEDDAPQGVCSLLNLC